MNPNPNLIYWFVFVLSFFALLFISLLLIWNSRVLNHQKKLSKIEKENQQKLLKASIDTQELERKRISENLHDDLGPLLSALKLQLNYNADELDKENLKSTLALAVENLRSVSRKMSPAVLEQLGLNKAIKNSVERIKKSSDWKIDFFWDDKIESLLQENQKIHLYRIIQEATNNVVKHAKATLISLMGEIQAGKIKITIADNGVGFSEKEEECKNGLGLNTMRARASIIEADFHMRTGSFGTKITVEIKSKL